jgi:hypothetical protein
VKSIDISKLAVLLVGLGGFLALAPQARAQSEVASDHFDGSDSWAVAASPKISAPRPKPRPATLQASSRKSATPAAQPAAARSVTVSRRSGSVSTKKRKPAAPKSHN